MQSEPQKTTTLTTYAYDILSPGELQTYLPAWRSVFVTSELSRRKTVQIDSSGTIRYRNEIRPLIPPPQEKAEAETLLWEYMSQLTNNLKEQIAPKGKSAGTEYFPPDFPADVFSQSNWKILTMEPEAHDKIPGLTRTWKAVLRPVLEAFAEITILGVTLTKKILLPIEGANLTVRFAGNLVTDLDLASPIALKTTRKTEPLKIAAEHLRYVTSEAILEMLEFGFRIVDGGLRVREVSHLKNISDIEEIGIIIDGLENEQQIRLFLAKIQVLVPTLTLAYKYTSDENAMGKGTIYKISGEIDGGNPIQKCINRSFKEGVRFRNSKKVGYYVMFNGNTFQYINIDQYNSTSQNAFFIYALTHAITEFLWAVTLKITEKSLEGGKFDDEYKKAHDPTLFTDLEIFSYMIKTIYFYRYLEYLKNKYGPDEDLSQAKWTWWEDLNKEGYLRNDKLEGGKAKGYTSIVRKSDEEQELLRLECKGVEFEPDNFFYIEFIDLVSWGNLEVNEKPAYVKICL
ncbi:MAG: hypothetical protein K1X92_15730 [Bacteroidia bacterium]|nr:hypothetical protein [Bacteroidia bacterium]